MQLISSMKQIFEDSKTGLWLKAYEILATGNMCGLVEMNNDTNSIHGIKEKLGESSTLVDYFGVMFGSNRKEKKYKTA